MAGNLIKIVHEVINETNFEIGYDRYAIDLLCDRYVISILDTDTDVRHNIIGYTFPLNNAASNEICRDKCACAELLRKHRIPCVRCKLFITSRDNDNTVEDMIKYCKDVGFPVVIKDNHGTCGKKVYLIRNTYELRNTVSSVNMTHICVNKFIDIKDEYRVIVLNGEIQLCYTKMRPYVIGDGISTVRELIQSNGIKIDTIQSYGVSMDSIIEDGQKQILTWKHNLCNGAVPQIVDNPCQEIVTIAQDASRILGMNFCSVDIMSDGINLSVIEVNSGVMMEYFSKYNDNCYAIAKSIYRNAITCMLHRT